MPIYEYKCPQGHVFELFQRMSDPPPEACEVCGASPVTKVLYPAAIHFKGSGFYATDYGSKSRKRDGKDSDGAGSSDSAPAEKKEDKPKKEAAGA